MAWNISRPRELVPNPEGILIMDKSHVEAWKGVTEFTKIIVSLSTSVLTILIGYMTLNQFSFAFPNFIPPLFLVGSIVLALFGFGRAIPAIKSGDQSTVSILFSNLSVAALTVGILTIPLVSIDNQASIDSILKDVEKETQSLSYKLSPGACEKISVKKNIYTLTYQSGGKQVTVEYSKSSKGIISINP
jgi:hypothetical protein